MRTHSSLKPATQLDATLLSRWPWLLLVTFLALSCTLWPLPQKATAAEKPSEYEVEAAYLFNFGKFVTWPATSGDSKAPLTICVLGEDPLGSALHHIVSGEKIGDKPVLDKQISNMEEAAACSILYISSSEENHLTRILSSVKNAPVLTVSDIPDFLARGGIIQFVLRDNRVRFEVNLAPVKHDHLTLSSELLKVAASVQRGEGKP